MTAFRLVRHHFDPDRFASSPTPRRGLFAEAIAAIRTLTNSGSTPIPIALSNASAPFAASASIAPRAFSVRVSLLSLGISPARK